MYFSVGQHSCFHIEIVPSLVHVYRLTQLRSRQARTCTRRFLAGWCAVSFYRKIIIMRCKFYRRIAMRRDHIGRRDVSLSGLIYVNRLSELSNPTKAYLCPINTTHKYDKQFHMHSTNLKYCLFSLTFIIATRNTLNANPLSASLHYSIPLNGPST